MLHLPVNISPFDQQLSCHQRWGIVHSDVDNGLPQISSILTILAPRERKQENLGLELSCQVIELNRETL